MTGKGVIGDAEAKQHAEALNVKSDKFVINQLRHVANVTGIASQQRVTWSMRNECNSGLKDWWSDRIDVSIFNQLCGNSAQTDLEYTGLNAALAPTLTRHIFAGGATSEATLTGEEHGFNLKLIDRFILKARMASPAMRPIIVGGMKVYCVFISPNQAFQLRTSMTEGDWAAVQSNAMKGGLITKNPLFTGALGMWNNTLIFEDARVCFGDNEQAGAEYHTDLGAPSTSTTNIARSVFCGAQAAVFGVGRSETLPTRMRWVEELEDGENQLNIYAGMVFGIKKTKFDSVDFATIVGSTYSPGEA